MKKSTIYIKQPIWARLLNKIKFPTSNLAEIDLDQDTWYDSEDNFVWSYPDANINLINSDSITLVFNCPVGRDVIFKSKYFNVKHSLKKDKMYTFVIETKGLKKLNISTEPYCPSDDIRKLGLCFFKITDKL